MDYGYNGTSLSLMENSILKLIIAGENKKAVDLAKDYGWVEYKEDGKLKGNLERREFEAKLKDMNIKFPW